MATTVGYPIATGALLILDGALKEAGINSPTKEQVWRPLLAALESKGVKLVEERRRGGDGVGLESVIGQQVE